MSEHQVFFSPPAKLEMGRHEQLVFGIHAKRHAITGMPLEMGSGALSPDEQARRVHLPEIARTQGQAAADAMLTKLNNAAVQGARPTGGRRVQAIDLTGI